ncbi:MAG: DUF4124 domain-containing protein [Thiotrichaceae bacterium]
MRVFTLLLSFLFFTVASSISCAKIYSWKDASGKTVYGDNPPNQNKAKEVKTQELTVVPGYKDPSLAQVAEKTVSDDKIEDDQDKGYDIFNVTYPKNDEAIRTNDGNVTVAFELSPALKSTDTVFIYVDGKKVVEGSQSLTASLTSLDRGTHSMFAVVRNDNGDVLLNSNTVSFHIMRNSIITNPSR